MKNMMLLLASSLSWREASQSFMITWRLISNIYRFAFTVLSLNGYSYKLTQRVDLLICLGVPSMWSKYVHRSNSSTFFHCFSSWWM